MRISSQYASRLCMIIHFKHNHKLFYKAGTRCFYDELRGGSRLKIKWSAPEIMTSTIWSHCIEVCAASVTRVGNLLHFGQLFKACGNNYFAQIAHIFINLNRGIIFGQLFKWNNFCATFVDIWRPFTGHTACAPAMMG